uniref:Uncharacterized protein n=1 Tax=Oryza glumipatula TaxID=40148 RepID=A0A0D9ZHI0_9ORYZ
MVAKNLLLHNSLQFSRKHGLLNPQHPLLRTSILLGLQPTINYMAILLEASTIFSGKHIGYNPHTSELSMFSSTQKLGVLTKSNYWVCFFPRIRISLSVPARHEENNVANIEESSDNSEEGGRRGTRSLTSINLEVTAKGQSCNARHIGVVLTRKLENFVELILELETPGARRVLEEDNKNNRTKISESGAYTSSSNQDTEEETGRKEKCHEGHKKAKAKLKGRCKNFAPSPLGASHVKTLFLTVKLEK